MVSGFAKCFVSGVFSQFLSLPHITNGSDADFLSLPF